MTEADKTAQTPTQPHASRPAAATRPRAMILQQQPFPPVDRILSKIAKSESTHSDKKVA